MGEQIETARQRFYIAGSMRFQIWGIRIGRRYLSLAGPKSRPLFSERYRQGVRVFALGRGWRIRLRTDSSTPQSTGGR